jgi:hypothetical protein
LSQHRCQERLAPGVSRRDNGSVRLRVECYSGSKADERPVRFYLGEQFLMVEEILDQWYGPDAIFFKVRADDGNLYILRQKTSDAEREWTLESFRQLEHS